MRFRLSLLGVVSMLAVGSATTIAAQPPRETPAQNVDVRDDGDDGFDLGWLGLIGLAGLLGLKRPDRDRTVGRSDSGHSPSTR